VTGTWCPFGENMLDMPSFLPNSPLRILFVPKFPQSAWSIA